MCKYLNKNMIRINERNSCFHSGSLMPIASLTFRLQDSVDKAGHDLFAVKKPYVCIKIHNSPRSHQYSKFSQQILQDITSAAASLVFTQGFASLGIHAKAFYYALDFWVVLISCAVASLTPRAQTQLKNTQPTTNLPLSPFASNKNSGRMEIMGMKLCCYH